MSEMIQLTLPQQDVYFEQLLFPDAPIYNIGAKIKIQGNIDVKIMQEAYRALLLQHNTYRSYISNTDHTISFEELKTYDDVLQLEDFSNESNADEKANAFMQKRFTQPFDLTAKDLLHKFILIRVAADTYYLFSVYHHIITDGWGTSLMFQRLVANYNEIYANGHVISNYPYHYDDFISDDAAYQQSEEFQKDKTYWKTRFENLPETLFQPISGTKPQHKSQRKVLTIKRDLYNQLELLAKANRCSTFHVILGLLFVYFGRKQRNQDFAVGLPVLNRSKAIFKKTVGLFMGVSALRIQLEKEDTFISFLTKIRQQLRQDYRYQRFPLGKLKQELNSFNTYDRLFDITLSYEKQNYADHFLHTKTSVIPLTHQSERVPLALYIREFDPEEDVHIDFDYNISYFDETTITQVLTHFETLLKAVVENPEQNIYVYSYLTESEAQEIVHTFNKTHHPYPIQQTILDYIQEQVKNQPQKIAVRDEKTSFTYTEVEELSNTIAQQIQLNLNNSSQKPVAILMPRSAALIVCILGVLKSKRAFIPLDPNFPKERLQYIISHSETDLIIETAAESLLTTKIPKVTFESLCISSNEEITVPRTTITDSAYIIYTSGTTGKPKGVEIGHQALVNFLLSMKDRPGVSKNELLYAVTTQSFDISILEFLAPLIAGASVYVASHETIANPFELIGEIEKVSPSIIQATPSFFQLLFNAGWKGNPSLKILCGGDLLSKALAEKLLQNSKEVWNMYGPTETTIWSTCKLITKPEDASIIGSPIHNTQIFILDDMLQILPKQSIGTLYIGGDGLAKGYYKDEKLTAARFIENKVLQTRLYNTGDIAKWNDDGEIEFLGRDDFQVKIRGYRIELEDIEAKLHQIQHIKEAVVVAKKQQNQEAFLVAFVVANTMNIEAEYIKNILKTQLPSYMIPSKIITLEELPLTPNKKVDRKALTELDIQHSNTDQKPSLNPRTPLEKELCSLFKEILQIDFEPNLHTDFFEHGGHSLNAVKLIISIEKKLQHTLNLRTLFDHPTVEELANVIQNNSVETQKEHIPKAAQQPYYPITEAQKEIWMASQDRERSIAYNMFAAYSIEGTIDLQKLEALFEYLLMKYEILRTNFIEVGGIPHQIVRSEIPEFHIKKSVCTDKNIEAKIQEDVHTPFDLENDLLCVVQNYKSDSKNFLVFKTHHSIMDGWSLELLINEIVHLYQLDQLPQQIPNEQLQFRDYAMWQLQKNTDENYSFWNSYLKDYKWKPLFTSSNTKEVSADLEASAQFEYDCELWQQIQNITSSHNITLHSFLASMFSILLLKNYQHDEVCIGTINSGRNHVDILSQLGMYIKTLPLRSMYNKTQNVLEFLHAAQNTILEFDEHQDIPLEIRKNFLWDVILVIQNQSFNYETIKVQNGLTLRSHEIASLNSRVPLLLNFTVTTSLSLRINYDTQLFDADDIMLLAMRFEKLLKSAVQMSQETTLEELSIQLHQETSSDIDIDFNF